MSCMERNLNGQRIQNIQIIPERAVVFLALNALQRGLLRFSLFMIVADIRLFKMQITPARL